MRVAHVITRMIVGGAQENTLLNCQGLVEQHGDDVLLITGPSLGPEGSLLDRKNTWPMRIELLDSLRREVRPGQDWWAYQAVRQALQEFRPDVVHTHSAKAGILGRFAAWNLGVPAIVHTVHGAPFGRFGQQPPGTATSTYAFQGALGARAAAWCEWMAEARCDRLICVADAMREHLLAHRIGRPDKFVTIYSGMELEPFLHAPALREQTRKQWGLQPDDVVLGTIARLFELKGHDDLLAVAPEVLRRVPQVKFLWVGDGILRPRLEAQIKEQGLSSKFVLTGLRSPSEIPGLIAAMDMVVHTSLREGLARVLPQALLTGTPVVSYDVDGAREVVIPGHTGHLVPARSLSELSTALVEQALNPDLRKDFGERGKALCQERFDHFAMTAQIRALYQKLLASPRRGRGGEGGER